MKRLIALGDSVAVFALVVAGAGLLAACSDQKTAAPEEAKAPESAESSAPTAIPTESPVNPAVWPEARSKGLIDAATETRITELMATMSLEEKVGQLIQGDLSTIRPEDLREVPVGSILAGGSSAPLGYPDRAPAEAWVETAKAFRAVAMESREGHTPIPLLFGIDAVHGHGNVVGAVVFPHNVGLGAANDPDLVKRISEVTAIEVAATGINWAFAPTLAVPQDDRWGRTYEGYSESPDLVASYAAAAVEGLQGKAGKIRIQDGHVAGSAKHFLGDGGTEGGIDQGDTKVSEADLARIHGAGYPPAIDAGVMTVMASYNSWYGVKMHGNRSVLTDILKGRMGFDGFVVGDWNGHGQIPGCLPTNCPHAFNAGLDMAMAPDSWRELYANTLAQVKDGTIPLARVEDAVRRILRVKFHLGLFDPARPFEGRTDLVGSAEHRAVAREAVAKSLVLLKNEGGALPVKAGAKVLVAGAAANDMGQQTGGWTLSWQGDGNSRADFPNGQTILEGLQETMAAGGGSATFSADGSFTDKPDVAIVVFGEQPYAEMRGDLRTLEFEPGDKASLAILKKLKAAGVPVVSVFLSGRPMWVNPELNASDAFVAAWLPGSEGGGVADVLIGDKNGKVRADFSGKLSYSWPKRADQFTLNVGQEDYDPLFAFGYGLEMGEASNLPVLSEEPGIDASDFNRTLFFARGAFVKPYVASYGEGIAHAPVDSANMQEGAVELEWGGAAATFAITGPEMEMSRETNADMSLAITFRVDAAPEGSVSIAMPAALGDAGLDAKPLFSANVGEWRTAKLSLSCFARANPGMQQVASPLVVTASGPFGISISDARIVTDPEGRVCPDGSAVD
ncbi:glycoside hydrolase family 3 protein [Pseudokordiimonas caeni]|uniref:glycoside hydrolase family 3 protein n=1 Tax=Pseudokordiimonas caeni TaxID=2997908 RepID=UPI00281177BE|nr:glycoside hydrolase family 3 N-terminal domain-containing protein [Pseudokordiimonas caeni]